MSGTYIECDRCGTTLSGADPAVSKQPKGLTHGQNDLLREAARRLGWTGAFQYEGMQPIQDVKMDLCPKCTSSLASAE